MWYEEREGRGAEADAHLAQAAEYAARVPPGEAMCQIAADQACNLLNSGHAEEALDLTTASDRGRKPSGLGGRPCLSS